MKVLKFGGKSLANGSPIEGALDIIAEASKGPISVIVSARGTATDQLLQLYRLAVSNKDYLTPWDAFVKDQTYTKNIPQCEEQFNIIKGLLKAISQLQTDVMEIEETIIAHGEILSAMTISLLLKDKGIDTVFKDARELIFTKNIFGDNIVDIEKSRAKTKAYFEQLKNGQTPIITGFIASDEQGKTVTLGRNGSNYSATLIAQFTKAVEVQNWTDIDGIYTANPKIIANAKKIAHLSYEEANELANFGVNILHPKTIFPLKENGIPLVIKNSFKPQHEGTLVDATGSGKGIKAVSILSDVSLITIEGRGLLGKVGIDSRIFSVLERENISVRLISQASSERGIGFVIDKENAVKTKQLLEKEFHIELQQKDISKIGINNEMSIIAIVGRHNYALEKAIKGLRRNKIWMYLISNSISGNHISLVIDNKHLEKALRIVHDYVFEAITTLNVFTFGKGNVGGAFIDQINNTPESIIKNRKLNINIIGIADSKHSYIDFNGLDDKWRACIRNCTTKLNGSEILNKLDESGLENIVIVDNTSSTPLSELYPKIIEQGFDIVASNKKANSMSFDFYSNLRLLLSRKDKSFLYETNVGAGLPIIQPIQELYRTGESIKIIKGVFSGSLSYIFNRFSIEDTPFSRIIADAKSKGFTEPDPREDLEGMDVARKLIILAREIGLDVELTDVNVENLIPKPLRGLESYDSLLERTNELDTYYKKIKASLAKNEVLRYIGLINTVNNQIEVKLIKVDKSSNLGGLTNAEVTVEIYTNSYQDLPMTIKGPGAGPQVTARGVYTDLIRLGRRM